MQPLSCTKTGTIYALSGLTAASGIIPCVFQSPTLDKTIAAAQAVFAVKIKEMIPGITDAQIDQIRQAIAGEVNKGKADIIGQLNDPSGPDIPAGAALGSGAVTPSTNGAQ